MSKKYGFRGSKRRKMSSRGSRKLFSSTASKMHSRNAHRSPMRGGFRL